MAGQRHPPPARRNTHTAKARATCRMRPWERASGPVSLPFCLAPVLHGKRQRGEEDEKRRIPGETQTAAKHDRDGIRFASVLSFRAVSGQRKSPAEAGPRWCLSDVPAPSCSPVPGTGSIHLRLLYAAAPVAVQAHHLGGLQRGGHLQPLRAAERTWLQAAGATHDSPLFGANSPTDIERVSHNAHAVSSSAPCGPSAPHIWQKTRPICCEYRSTLAPQCGHGSCSFSLIGVSPFRTWGRTLWAG